tara:strand:- start:653 stop:1531 length:879 start_codon:yes stop_codon:yes gene_type:complete
MKYNTISEYMGGGYMRPQMYNQGGRASKNILGQAFIRRGIKGAEKSLSEAGKDAQKESQRRGLFSTVGGFLGNYVAPLILSSTPLGQMGLVGNAIMKGIGSAGFSALGDYFGGVSVPDKKIDSPTGFLSSSFEDIQDYRDRLGEGLAGRALGRGASTAFMSGIGDYLQDTAKLKAISGSAPTGEYAERVRQGADLQMGVPTAPSGVSKTLETIDKARATDVYSELDKVFQPDSYKRFNIGSPNLGYSDFSFQMPIDASSQPFNIASRMEGGSINKYMGGGLLYEKPFHKRII